MYTVGLIGVGNMGKSILTCLSQASQVTEIWAFDRDMSQIPQLTPTLQIAPSMQHMLPHLNVLILAVKPQQLAPVLTTLQPIWVLHQPLIISIVAGVTVAHFRKTIPERVPLVRAMPNTALAQGLSATGFYAEPTLAADVKQCAHDLLACMGEVFEVPQEFLLDVITAVAASGIAYFYALMHAMMDETLRHGFDPDTARRLITQTARGAAEMAYRNADTPFTVLRDAVTSKGGTTAAALAVFKAAQFDTMVANAITAAVARASELSSDVNC